MALSNDDRAEIRQVIQMSKDLREGKTARPKKRRAHAERSKGTQPTIQRQEARNAKRAARRQRNAAQKRVAGKIDSLTSLDDIARELLPAAISHLVTRLVIEPSNQPGLGRDLGKLITPDQAAEILGVHKRWVYDNSSMLGGFKLSKRKLRFREDELRAYLERSRQPE